MVCDVDVYIWYVVLMCVCVMLCCMLHADLGLATHKWAKIRTRGDLSPGQLSAHTSVILDKTMFIFGYVL